MAQCCRSLKTIVFENYRVSKNIVTDNNPEPVLLRAACKMIIRCKMPEMELPTKLKPTPMNQAARGIEFFTKSFEFFAKSFIALNLGIKK